VTISIYQAREDGARIRKTFSAMILPAPTAGCKEPWDFEILFKNVFENRILDRLKPTDRMTFSLTKHAANV